jgi:hypothetical protein
LLNNYVTPTTNVFGNIKFVNGQVCIESRQAARSNDITPNNVQSSIFSFISIHSDVLSLSSLIQFFHFRSARVCELEKAMVHEMVHLSAVSIVREFAKERKKRMNTFTIVK